MQIEAHKTSCFSQVRAVLFLCFALFLASVVTGTPSAGRNRIALVPQTTSPFTLADFDGDSQLDVATVQPGSSDTRYWIDFHLSTGLRQFIGVTAPIGGLRIASGDVNGDKFVDVIVTATWEHRTVAVLLNDGRGNFTLRDPGEFIAAIRDGEGPSAFALTHQCDFGLAALPRSCSGPHVATQAAVAPPQSRESGFPDSSRQPKVSSPIASVFDRAPPASIPHI